MAKQDKTNKDAATDSKTDMVVQPETTPETENKNETPEVHSDSEQSTVETVGSGQTEGVTDTVLDSESEAETTGKEGIEAGGKIGEQKVTLTESDLPRHSHDPEKIFQPSEPKAKTEQRERIAKDVFAKNHRKSVLYFTSDMIPFFEKTDAIKHIKELDDKTIVTVNKQ